MEANMSLYSHLTKYLLTEQQLAENCYPFPGPNGEGKAIVKADNRYKKTSPSSTERFCARCGVLYSVDEKGVQVDSSACFYHTNCYALSVRKYLCCGQEDSNSQGCCQSATHVSHNYNPNELLGYVQTKPAEDAECIPGVYALDCEMCYTTAGLEVTRVSVIGENGETVYNSLVKPENSVIDYNTKYSGITESDLENEKTTLKDVQAFLLAQFSDKTILVGHGLENDLHALKLIHKTIVDTSIVFTNINSPSKKPALRCLAKAYLNRTIQDQSSGHDSIEDAMVCLDLVNWKHEDDKLRCPTTDESDHNTEDSNTSVPFPSSPPAHTVTPQPTTTLNTQATTTPLESQSEFTVTPCIITQAEPYSPPRQGNRSKYYQTKPCKYFQSGTCLFGNVCKFKHSLEGTQETRIIPLPVLVRPQLVYLPPHEQHIMHQLQTGMGGNTHNMTLPTYITHTQLAEYLIIQV